MADANTEVRMGLLTGQGAHNVLVTVAETWQLIKLGKGETMTLTVSLGPGERALGPELELKRKYRGAIVAGHRLAAVRVLSAGPTRSVPTPPIDGRLTIEVSGPAIEEPWGYD
ncbi:MAG: hypothetical protein KC613_27855 [Myxococcales bacterium]|nr:hypothetical protein [Myxococcales bacterium]MCB9526515.1 hypothetical protein [Myxococcales bacterium]